MAQPSMPSGSAAPQRGPVTAAERVTPLARAGVWERMGKRVGREMTGSAGGRAAIVVGVDGSDCSKDTLRWAARQAEFTGATVDAIAAWKFPAFYGWAPADSQDLDFPRFAEQALAHPVDEVFGRIIPPGCGPGSLRATRPRSWSRRRQRPTCWSWAAAGTGDSPVRCSARLAPTAFITPDAQSPSSGPVSNAAAPSGPGSAMG